MNITCTRKEDDLYYQGPFWLIADSFLDILRGKFELVGSKFACNYDGDYVQNDKSKSQRTHKKIWDSEYSETYETNDYTFFPRGRVSIYKGVTFIHINSKCNVPKVINKIINEYNLGKLEIEIDLNDTYQGSHYDFKLQ